MLKQLFDAVQGFSDFLGLLGAGTFEPIQCLAQVGEARVWAGSRRNVPLVTKNAITLAMPNAQRSGLTASIVYQRPIPAPIREGQHIANLVVEGPAYGRRVYPLVAGRRIGRANWFARAWVGFASLFGGVRE